ncbi:MAG: hypothetical protein FJX65_05405 [Alphaproteobacteria bacterium]|nr:hypothetical protein [Alphaproteobacteria bacterium]
MRRHTLGPVLLALGAGMGALSGAPTAHANPDLLGCFTTDGPNAAIYMRITQGPSGYLITFQKSNQTFPLSPAPVGDLQLIADDLDLALNKISGIRVLYGLSNEDDIIAALSAEIDWRDGRTRYVAADEFGAGPLFKVACR